MSKASETPAFYHERLKSARHIRVVQLLPRDESSPSPSNGSICCTISQHLLDESTYSAVSYTWGEEGTVHTLSIDGRPFPIRYNLYCLLNALLERNDCSRFFWIDQLSIDQANVDERNAQVQLMGDIYSSAGQVYVWLGSEIGNTTRAFSVLERCEQFFEQQGKRNHGSVLKIREEENEHWDQRTITNRHDRLVDKQALDNFEASMTDHDWEALSELFSQHYWSRLWIVQEIYLAEDICLLWGSKLHRMFMWEDVALSPGVWQQIMLHTRLKLPRSLRLSSSPLTLLAYREDRTMTRRRHGPDWSEAKKSYDMPLTTMPLSDLLLDHTGRQCSDPRDKVYGLQGCLRVEEKVIVNYNKNTEEVLQDQFEVLRRYMEDSSEPRGSQLMVEWAHQLRANMGLEAWSEEKIRQEYV